MIVMDSFEATASDIARRTSELLCAQVFVTDERGRVIASEPAPILGPLLDQPPEESISLRVPVKLQGRSGEVLVGNSTNNGELVSPRLTCALVELVVNQATVVDRLPNHDELKNKFVHDLLQGTSGEDDSIRREAQVLGIDITRPRSVILIDASEYILAGTGEYPSADKEARIRRRSQLLIGSIVRFFMLADDTICAYIGNGEIVVLKASTTRDLSHWLCEGECQEADDSWANLRVLKRAAEALRVRLETDTRSCVTVGVGRYYPGTKGLPLSYRDAWAALRLGQQFQGTNRVHSLDGVGIATFIGVNDDKLRQDLAGHLLGPLDDSAELIRTLEVFFEESCSPSSTSERLMLHRNTLSYRLAKVYSLTGLDPRRFDDAVQLRLALAVRRLDRSYAEPRE